MLVDITLLARKHEARKASTGTTNPRVDGSRASLVSHGRPKQRVADSNPAAARRRKQTLTISTPPDHLVATAAFVARLASA